MSPEAPLDPAVIAGRQFATARRGLDAAAVRAYLHELSRAIESSQRYEAELLARAQQAESRAVEAERLDEHRLVELLGEETARVLAASRDAAADIKAKAQEAAARLISQANEEAHQIRADAESATAAQRAEMMAGVEALRREASSELDRRRTEADDIVAQMVNEAESECEGLRRAGDQARREADDDAKAIRAEARDEGRQMVAEAQLVRERMLRDLARRRRAAREQLERLHAARDRLLAAYEVVRRTVAEATTELQVALPEAKIAGDQAMRRVHEEPEPTVDELEAQVSMARIAGLLDPLQPTGQPQELVGGADELDLADQAARGVATARTSGAGLDLGRQATSTDESELTDAPGESVGPDAPGELEVEPAVAPEVAPGRFRTTDPEPVAAGGGGVAIERVSSAPQARDAAGGEGPKELDDSADHPGGELGPGELDQHPETESPDDADGTSPTPDLDELFARLREGRSRESEDRENEDRESEDREPALVGAETPSAASRGGVENRSVNGDSADGVVTVHPLTWPETEHATATDADVGAADRHGPPADEPGPATEARDHGRLPDEERGELPEAGLGQDEPSAGSGGGHLGGTGHGDGTEAGHDEQLLRRRDEALSPIEHDLGRLLKRALADEQNEVLDLLRRTKPTSVADLLPGEADHAERYADAARDELEAAANCGAIHVADAEEPQSEGFCDALAAELSVAIVGPLRERIERSFVDTGGDLDEVTGRLRALYREWKGQRIAGTVRHYSVAAYAQGAYAALADGAPLRWLVDRSSDPCPDADDNALAGLVCKGEPFPTGGRCPPAHLGCRCLVVSNDA